MPRKLPKCQVPGCDASLSSERAYYQRYRICSHHTRVPELEFEGSTCRWCQQCGRFQPLPDFDSNYRTCRQRLARHNERRMQRLANNKNRASASASAQQAGAPRAAQQATAAGEAAALNAQSPTLTTTTTATHTATCSGSGQHHQQQSVPPPVIAVPPMVPLLPALPASMFAAPQPLLTGFAGGTGDSDTTSNHHAHHTLAHQTHHGLAHTADHHLAHAPLPPPLIKQASTNSSGHAAYDQMMATLLREPGTPTTPQNGGAFTPLPWPSTQAHAPSGGMVATPTSGPHWKAESDVPPMLGPQASLHPNPLPHPHYPDWGQSLMMARPPATLYETYHNRYQPQHHSGGAGANNGAISGLAHHLRVSQMRDILASEGMLPAYTASLGGGVDDGHHHHTLL